jgi:hypothetical protein
MIMNLIISKEEGNQMGAFMIIKVPVEYDEAWKGEKLLRDPDGIQVISEGAGPVTDPKLPDKVGLKRAVPAALYWWENSPG